VKPALVISARDNVATALETLDTGRKLALGDRVVLVRERIPAGHKIALAAIAQGDAVVKYGSEIGRATADIAAGAHVHTHNLSSTRGRGDLKVEAAARDDAARLAEPPDISGRGAGRGRRHD
jgi:altronate dehydratase